MPAEDMFHELLLTFFTAMTPILELRGAIPVGVAAGLPPAVACAVSIVGNLVPVPFIILLTRRIFDWLRRTRTFGPGSSGWSAGPISRGGWCASTVWRG